MILEYKIHIKKENIQIVWEKQSFYVLRLFSAGVKMYTVDALYAFYVLQSFFVYWFTIYLAFHSNNTFTSFRFFSS